MQRHPDTGLSDSPSDVQQQPSKPAGPQYGKKRWTFGNSGSLVEGSAQESPWVSALWIAVPTGLALLLLAAMLHS